MNNYLNTYNDILFSNLRPWIFGRQSDMKFKQLLHEVKKEYYSYTPLFEVGFTKPLSNIRKYYNTIIENEAIKYLNNIHFEISSSLNDNERAYIIHFALNKLIPKIIKELANLIQERNYTPEQYQPNQQSKTDTFISNESYILYLLKHHLVRLYLEIQNSYSEFIKDDLITLDDIYIKFFNEPAPANAYVIKAKNFPKKENIKQPTPKEIKPAFHAIRDDIKEPVKNIYSYKQLIKNPSRFSQVEEDLYRNELIDNNYNFTNKYGMKQLLAAFYHQLIRKGYFNERIFPGNIKTNNLAIRKFLDHRYGTNVDKQFRNWNNNQTELLSFIERDYWIDNIPAC